MLRLRALTRTRHFSNQATLNDVRSSAGAPPPLSPLLTESLASSDPYMFDLIEKEKQRQRNSLTLIPSENFTSPAVLEALGSVMQNKYSEGYPGARYYGGNEYIDEVERECIKRALDTYRLDPEEWGVNVQALSGSPANFYVYTALLEPFDRMMALDLPHGGHLSHGYATPTKKISAVSKYFQVLPYRLNEQTGHVDYDNLENLAKLYRPKLIVSGGSAYAQDWEHHRLKQICEEISAISLYDMAHVSGLLTTEGLLNNPFEAADIITTTTHKSLRGPRGAMIFYRKAYGPAINAAVFPGHQGGPHNHTITALSVALKQAQSSEFQTYQTQVVRNAARLATTLQELGYVLVSGGTQNHLMLIDLRPNGIDGAKVERVLELGNIACNKNTVPGDKSAMVPGGLRVGTPALTSRGMVERDMEQVAALLDHGIKLAKWVQDEVVGSTKRKLFMKELESNAEVREKLEQFRQKVASVARQFHPVGYQADQMKYED